MKTLIQARAEEYAKRIAEEQKDAYIFTDAEVLVEDAYKAGAKDEHRLLTEWQSIKEDKYGFTSDEDYDKIVSNLPIL